MIDARFEIDADNNIKRLSDGIKIGGIRNLGGDGTWTEAWRFNTTDPRICLIKRTKYFQDKDAGISWVIKNPCLPEAGNGKFLATNLFMMRPLVYLSSGMCIGIPAGRARKEFFEGKTPIFSFMDKRITAGFCLTENGIMVQKIAIHNARSRFDEGGEMSVFEKAWLRFLKLGLPEDASGHSRLIHKSCLEEEKERMKGEHGYPEALFKRKKRIIRGIP